MLNTPDKQPENMTSDHQPLVKQVRTKLIFPNLAKVPHSVAKGLFFCLLLWGITACQSTRSKEAKSTNRDNIFRSDTQLVLHNAVLEQSNPQGNMIWKVKSAETVYSQDRQTAKLDRVTANLIQEGEIILQLSSKRGEIQQNGLVILLQDQILVTDPRNQAVVRSEALEWRPSEQVLIASQGITASNDNLTVEAEKGTYLIDTEQLDLSGNVIGTSLKPSMILKTNHLTWKIPEQKVIGDRPLEVVRYQDEQITDRVVANRGEVDLQKNIISLHKDIEMRSVEPSLQIATNSVNWNYQTRIVTTNQPIQILDLTNQLDITGNKGKIDLNQQIANLDNGIKGINKRNQSKLYARQLVWYIPTEEVEATGNVIYQQADPPLNLVGDKAIGKLKENSVVVTSNNQQNRVFTEIVP